MSKEAMLIALKALTTISCDDKVLLNGHSMQVLDARLALESALEDPASDQSICIKDRFAMAALTGLIAKGGNYFGDQMLVREAYRIADVAIAERKS